MYYLFVILAEFLDKVLWVYSIIIIIRALMSWFNPNPANPVVRFIYGITDPVLNPVRDFVVYRLRLALGGLDISPIIVLVTLYFIRVILVGLLYRFAITFA